MAISPTLPLELGGLDEAGGAATIAQQSLMPAGNLPEAAVKKPSLFTRILSGALLGMGAGLAAENPGQAFGAGFGAPEAARDRELKRQLMAQQAQREQQKVGIEQQQANTAQQAMENQKITLDAQAATAKVDKLRIEKELEFMPTEQARKHSLAWAQMYSYMGKTPLFEFENTPEGKTAYLQQMGADGKNINNYMEVPSVNVDARGFPKIVVYERDPNRRLTPENSKELLSFLGLKGFENMQLPEALVEKLIDKTLEARNAYAINVLGYQKAIELATLQAGLRVSSADQKKWDALLEDEAEATMLLEMFDTAPGIIKDKQGNIIEHPWVGGVWQGMGGTKGRLKGKYPSLLGANSPQVAQFRTASSRIRGVEIHKIYGAVLPAGEIQMAAGFVPDIDNMDATTYRAALITRKGLAARGRQILLARVPGLQGGAVAKPEVGERKKFPPSKDFPNGTIGEWDGTGWNPVK
jgi:hypothetical protein